MMQLIIGPNTPAILKLSDLISDRSVTAFTCTIKAGTVVTVIDDYAGDSENMQVTLYAERDAKLFYLQENSTIKKCSIDMLLSGDRAEIIFHAIGQLHGDQQHELITRQIHTADHTISKSKIRFVHADRSRSNYQGTIVVEKSGQHSQAFQDHKALLISPDARAYARPTLEAKTNELQCGHGSAIGFLDEQQLWYLQSRGLDSLAAQSLLIKAFLQQ